MTVESRIDSQGVRNSYLLFAGHSYQPNLEISGQSICQTKQPTTQSRHYLQTEYLLTLQQRSADFRGTHSKDDICDKKTISGEKIFS